MSSLLNKTVLVTRESKGAAVFYDKLKAYQASPLVVPLLEINCIEYTRQKRLPVKIDTFEWVFFTSKNGVECFLEQQEYASALHACHIAAVGIKTAEALEQHGYTVDFIPSRYNAEVMSEEFLIKYPRNGPTLFVRGVLASPVLLEAFTNAGRPFDCLEVYETRINETAKGRLQSYVDNEKIDYLTFTSPSAVDAFAHLVEPLENHLDVPTVCIGTTTEKKAKEYGFTKTMIPDVFTIDCMVSVMMKDSVGKDESE